MNKCTNSGLGKIQSIVWINTYDHLMSDKIRKHLIIKQLKQIGVQETEKLYRDRYE